jgi:trans-2,3-dihydro-3-hydroxyanthranilate isomerase
MPQYDFVTVDVFTATPFGGNPLAVFPSAEGLSDAQMQALAAELNLSETTFVLPPDDPKNTARVRIFTRTSEMPFAGHPNVGTAHVLASMGLVEGPVLRFEEIAGLVEVRLRPGGAEIDAPQPLSVLGELPAAMVADCIGLPPDRLCTTRHAPVRASTGVEFVLVEVEPDALGDATPDLLAFRRGIGAHPELKGRLSIFAYALDAEGDVRARMFAPLGGTWEDPATGSANASLAALRLSLSDRDSLEYSSVQGVEMGRRSELELRAWRTANGVRASVAGGCVRMFEGRANL